MAHDFFHHIVKAALEKDGWEISHDPYELLRRDVPASDIVLGFHPPEYRQYTGFAAA